MQLVLGCFMGTFIFPHPPVYGWYLSATAIPLNVSWCLHNVISWLKIKPFLTRKWSYIFIISVCLSFPYWIVEIYANFTYFNGINAVFSKTRPYEAIFRDPWWVFTTAFLFYQIATHYRIKLTALVWISPRFGVLLIAMLMSIMFIVLDILSVTHVFDSRLPDGLNPFWKLATVFKCLTDSIVLDDFKTALDRLMRHKLRREGMTRTTVECFGTTIGSSEPPSAGGRRDAYTGWTPSMRERAHEDPLGEDSNERRMTNGTDVCESPIKEECFFSKGLKTGSISTKGLDEEIAAFSGPPPAHTRAPAPLSGHIAHYEDVPLGEMLMEKPAS